MMDYEAFKKVWLPQDTYMLEPQVEAGYRVKYDIAKRLNPWNFVEIGVRAGYSMWCFLHACPDAAYLGLDIDTGRWGGHVGATDHARAVLGTFPVKGFGSPAREIRIRDTMTLPELYTNARALWHVDGDHSLAGAMSDLLLAYRGKADWILIDDTDFIPEVTMAVNAFFLRFGTTIYAEAGVHEVRYTREDFHDGYRGHVLLTRV